MAGRVGFGHRVSALLFDPGSPGSLSEAVVTLLRDGELATRLSENARRAASRLMTPDEVVKTHGSLYKKLCAESIGDVS